MKAKKDAGDAPPPTPSETPTNAPTPPETTYPPTLSTATAMANGVLLTAARVITTKFGERAILMGSDGKEYWGSPFITRQVLGGTAPLPAKIVSYTSAKYGKTGYKLISA